MMYITAVSGVLIAAGTIIRNAPDGIDIPDYINLQFAGGFLITFFAECEWTSQLRDSS